jgi:predicted nucleotidyltransferase
VAGQIAERFHPQRVVLFGSYAYGHPTPDSDVDLLVLMEPGASTLQCAATISKEIDHPFPLDIVVLSPTDWEEYLKEGAVFPRQICEKGLVLYEMSVSNTGSPANSTQDRPVHSGSQASR